MDCGLARALCSGALRDTALLIVNCTSPCVFGKRMSGHPGQSCWIILPDNSFLLTARAEADFLRK
jgi:hypothetical protein